MIRSFKKSIFVFTVLISLPFFCMTTKNSTNNSGNSSVNSESPKAIVNKNENSRNVIMKDIEETSQNSSLSNSSSPKIKVNEHLAKKSSKIPILSETSNHLNSVQSSNRTHESILDEQTPVQMKDSHQSCESHNPKMNKVVIDSRSHVSHNKTPSHLTSEVSSMNNSSVQNPSIRSKIVKIKNLKATSKKSELRSEKSRPLNKDALEKSRSRYEKLGANEDDHVCKKQLMTIFSVEGNQFDQAIKATPREKSYCRRNHYTCCSDFNISSVNKYYGMGRKKLRLKFEVIEELLALFRGPKFIEYVQERRELSKCAPLVADMKVTIKGNNYTFFDLTYLRHQMEMAENLLMDTEIYIKKILWFYGDSICAICSPKVQDYFDFSDSTPKVHMHINTCSERIEEREYERNLLLLYDRFISKSMQFIKCAQGEEEKEESDDPDGDKSHEADETENEENFLPIDEEEQETFLNTFDECWNDQNVSNPVCKAFCKKNMRKYEFPINHLFHNFKVALSTLYSAMTGGNSIAEYYENIKEIEWKIEDEGLPIEFFPESDDWNKYKMDNIEWEFHSSTGHNVFKEIMSKKFTGYEESVLKLVSFFAVSIIAFFVN